MAFNWYLEPSCMYVIDEDLIQLIESYHVHVHSRSFVRSHELNMSKKLIGKVRCLKNYVGCVGSTVSGAFKCAPEWQTVQSSILSYDRIFKVFL